MLPIRNSPSNFMEMIKQNNITQLFNVVSQTNDLKHDAEEHLFKVYILLMTCSFLCGFGVHLSFSLKICWAILGILFMIFSLLVVIVTDEQEEGTRFFFIAIFSVQSGFLVGRHIQKLFSLRKNLVIYSLLLTIAKFILLSFMTYFFKHRISLNFFINILVCFATVWIIYILIGSQYYKFHVCLFSASIFSYVFVYISQFIIE